MAIQVIQITKWRSSDGQEHDTQAEAERREFAHRIYKMLEDYYDYGDISATDIAKALLENKAEVIELLNGVKP